MSRRVRTREPERNQVAIRFEAPEDVLPADHRARVLWHLLGQLDLSPLLAEAKSVEGRQGRDVLSVRMLLTLWLYAISEGIGSGREIERRLKTDPAFQWIVGDQSVGRTKLNEFRVSHRVALDKIFTDVLAVLLHEMQLLSLDGARGPAMRTRVRRQRLALRLVSSRRIAGWRVASRRSSICARCWPRPVRYEADLRARKAREAKAREHAERVEAAIAAVKQLDNGRRDSKPRASTTDPEARVMKMPDGGFRPAFNVQLATAGSPEGGPRTIVGARVTNVGSDMGSVKPMLDDIAQRTGRLPETLLADANHASFEDIKDAAARGVEALVSVPKRSKNAKAQAERAPEIEAWLKRMETDEAKEKFRARASLCELTNAHAKSRFALSTLLVRGIEKVTCVVLLTALVSNLLAHAPSLLA
jgi:transposase